MPTKQNPNKKSAFEKKSQSSILFTTLDSKYLSVENEILKEIEKRTSVPNKIQKRTSFLMGNWKPGHFLCCWAILICWWILRNLPWRKKATSSVLRLKNSSRKCKENHGSILYIDRSNKDKNISDLGNFSWKMPDMSLIKAMKG